MALAAAHRSFGELSTMTTPLPSFPPLDELAGDPADFDLEATMAAARPLVIRGLVRNWPIVKLALDSPTAFAQRMAQYDNGSDVSTLMVEPEAGGVIGYKPDLSDFNYRHFKVPVTLGLQRLAKYSRLERAPGLVIQSAEIGNCLPGFLLDHALPFLDGKTGPRLWMGNRTITPTHFDSQHNIACVVCGARRFTLFPPEQIANLYVGPLDYAPTGAAISLARLTQADDPRFPRLKLALATGRSAELRPGDAIYIPPLWWHHVASLEDLNALINYWWSPIAVPGFTTAHGRAALFHSVLAYRSLSAPERAAWRRFFDYYVFNDADPAAHIPPARRGVLGPLTADSVKQLKEVAKQNL